MSDEKETVIRVSERAVTRIQEMASHVREIGSFYEDATRLRTAESFAHAMVNVFRLGGEIWAEGPAGDLSLGGRTESGMVYGVIAFTFPAESRLPNAPAPVAWSIHS